MSEIWKPVPGYSGHYMASDAGRIISLARTVTRRHPKGEIRDFKYRERVLVPKACNEDGHMTVHLGVDGKKFNRFVHTLVLEAFVGPCPDGMECCHGNGIASDNRLQNLRWDTHAANNADRHAQGNYPVGSAHPQAKFSPEIIRAIVFGEMGRSDAFINGVSHTHYYRLSRKTADWFKATYPAVADRLWAQSTGANDE
jgi:hypothetical protein